MEKKDPRQELGYVKQIQRPALQWVSDVLDKPKRAAKASPLLEEWMKEKELLKKASNE